MLPLNVPFLPEESYIRFLRNLGPQIYAVHFSLYESFLCDARVHLQNVETQTLIDLLAELAHPKKYLLANGRFQRNTTYSDTGELSRLIKHLENLLEAGVIDGLIFADSYLLTALSDASPEITAKLEAVPSINFGIDNIEKLHVLMDLVSSCGFHLPGKISIDRSLNRKPAELASFSREIRNLWPDTKIELLANEGCLNHCPFRSTHEALIAAANNIDNRRNPINTQQLNRDLACIRHFSKTPHRIFASPFIRPEDVSHYTDCADLIKICGRTLGSAFLKRTVEAYANGSYQGNLLDLLDATHWMAESWKIPNENLPQNFFEMLTACEQNCSDCCICKNYFETIAQQKPMRIKNLNNSQY